MIISYELRNARPGKPPSAWVEFCGMFDSWEHFERFKRREKLDRYLEVRNAKEAGTIATDAEEQT